jgi:hypothetical protein
MAWHAPSLPLLDKSFRIFFSVKEKSKGYRIAHLTILFSTMNPRSQFASGFQYIYIYSTPRLILILALVGGGRHLLIDQQHLTTENMNDWVVMKREMYLDFMVWGTWSRVNSNCHFPLKLIMACVMASKRSLFSWWYSHPQLCLFSPYKIVFRVISI